MSDAPTHAGDDFSEEYYDIVTWDPAFSEWVPRGYLLTEQAAKGMLARKRQVQPTLTHRAVKVETIVRHIDVTDVFDNEGIYP